MPLSATKPGEIIINNFLKLNRLMKVCICVLCFVCVLNCELRKVKQNTRGEWESEAQAMEARCAQLGLLARTHAVRVKDARLALTRIRARTIAKRRGPPVLMVIGLMQRPRSWLDPGNASLAVRLAKTGYDVWLAGERVLHKRSLFSAQEMGATDLPALTDYVLQATDATSLHYIGFSQSGGTFFIMCNESPAHCSKYSLMIALAPAARIANVRSIARLVFQFYAEAEEELYKRGIYEVLPKGGFVQSLSKLLCNLPIVGLGICASIKDIYDGPSSSSVAGSTYLEASTTFPAGTTVRNMARYGQNMRSEKFQKYDYGPEKNLMVYGNETAPEYNLSAVTIPTVIIYSQNDYLVDVSNIKWLIRRLPNIVDTVEVEDPTWSHMDFTMSKNIPKYIYPAVENNLVKYGSNS